MLFILTTNRPDQIEPALVSRPGRIDQAIEFPLLNGLMGSAAFVDPIADFKAMHRPPLCHPERSRFYGTGDPV